MTVVWEERTEISLTSEIPVNLEGSHDVEHNICAYSPKVQREKQGIVF